MTSRTRPSKVEDWFNSMPYLPIEIHCSQTQQFVFSHMTRSFGGTMIASIDGAGPGYMTLTPHILAPRHVSPPPILGNNLAIHHTNPSGWPSSTEAQARMDGSFPEYMAHAPSTSRWAS